jgi:hypothetical protein
MTKNRAQKNSVRARAEETGERYVVARRAVVGDESEWDFDDSPQPNEPWLKCASCGGELDVRVEGLFCSDLCQQTAKFVRYARRKLREGTVGDDDITYAIQIRMASLLSGGYPEQERRLAPATRAAVFERDRGRCVRCGKPGAEVDHIHGSSDDLSNLQLLCSTCHREKTEQALTVAPPEQQRAAMELWTGRVESAQPTRLCDDPDKWPAEFRRLKSERRKFLLEELSMHGVQRADFPGSSWAEMWDEIEDGEAPDYGVWDDIEGPPQCVTEDEIDYHDYLQDVMARDD